MTTTKQNTIKQTNGWLTKYILAMPTVLVLSLIFNQDSVLPLFVIVLIGSVELVMEHEHE